MVEFVYRLVPAGTRPLNGLGVWAPRLLIVAVSRVGKVLRYWFGRASRFLLVLRCTALKNRCRYHVSERGRGRVRALPVGLPRVGMVALIAGAQGRRRGKIPEPLRKRGNG